MKKNILTLLFAAAFLFDASAQLNPAITTWLQNTTQTGTYYTAGNSTAQSNNIVVNCQKVQYSTNYVYVSSNGVPSYATGPFQDGNPSNATAQNAIYKFPLSPQQNTGTSTNTTAGNIGVFINGVSLYDYRDGVAWNSNTNSICGGPGNTQCPGGPGSTNVWNRDAIPAEKAGFDCSKGHPANGNYHHHQNPSAFKLDRKVISTVCNLYDADGLYVIDSTKHSPLIGFAYDGFPIYGAYGYKNTDGTGGITRIKSGYELATYSVRTHYPDGTDVNDGPAVSSTYFLGYFKEDYKFVNHTDGDYLDVHNGRFCFTPEYPKGTYCYFATVDEKWNSVYPYVVGPTFYGVYSNAKVTSITETTTEYKDGISGISTSLDAYNVSIFPNPSSDIIAVQIGGLVSENLTVELMDMAGKQISSSTISKGQTIAYFDVQTLYEGTYMVKITGQKNSHTQKVMINR